MAEGPGGLLSADHTRGTKMENPKSNKKAVPAGDASDSGLDVSALTLGGNSGENPRNVLRGEAGGVPGTSSSNCSQSKKNVEDDQSGASPSDSLNTSGGLSKRQQKRFRYKARKLALLENQSGTPTGSGGTKRTRDSDSTPTPPDARKSKKCAHERPQGRTFAQATRGVKIAVVPAAYPQGKMTQEQMRMVSDAIARRITEQDEGEHVPQFVDCKLSKGALVVTGEEVQDTKWLEVFVSGSSWPGGVTFKVLPMEKLVVHRRCIIYATTGLDGKGMVKALGRQNGTLDVGLWEVVNHVKDAGHGQSSVMVELPIQEWEALERLQRPMLGLMRAKCVLLEERGRKKSSKKPEASGSETATAEETKILEQIGSRGNRETDSETMTSPEALATPAVVHATGEGESMQVDELPPETRQPANKG